MQLTALVGAYALIRSISLIAGGFISEYTLMTQIKSGKFELYNWFYLYMAGFAAIAVGGTYWQWHKGYNKLNGKTGKSVEDPNADNFVKQV